MWKEVKEDEGDEFMYYKKKSDEDKKRYEKEMETYEPSDDDEDEEKPPPKKAKKEIAIKKTTSKQIETVGFKKFSNANREDVKEENPDFKPAQITKLLKEEWDDLDDDEKKEWFEEDQE